MSNPTILEDRVRRSLHTTAEAVHIDEREFVPGRPTIAALAEIEPIRRTRRTERTALVAAVVVAIVVAAAVIVRNDGSSPRAVSSGESSTSLSETSTSVATGPANSTPAPSDLVAAVAAVPSAIAIGAIGAGTASPMPVHLPGPALTDAGKPRIVWIGADWCPYCAAERWPLVLALSRFGTFSNLAVTSSAASPEVFPNTRSFSFAGSSFSSPYVTFESVEREDRAYKAFESPTSEQTALLNTYDAKPYVPVANTGAIPFLDLANSFLISGAQFDPALLQGKSASEIAAALSDPTSPIATAIDGSANVLTAAICNLTNSRPTNVCSTVSDLQHQLDH